MRSLHLIRRWIRVLTRAHKRYGNHPLEAIYLERLRRRYVRLGKWLARRQTPTMTVWPQIDPPALEPPYVPMPQTLQWPTMAWSRYYLDTHPELRKPRITAPLRRVELLPDDAWLAGEQETDPFDLASLDTRKVTPEETQKYKALPKFLRE